MDVGKTNAKVAIVDRIERTELDVRPRPNPAVDESPYPHYDVEAIWGLFAASMLELTSVHHIEGIAVSTHGASIVMLGHADSPCRSWITNMAAPTA